MDSRLGTRLPMVFAKGQPAKLHEMSLEQLRKFVPFLVKCETRMELPTTKSDDSTTVPSWWPSDLSFSQEVLYEKKPQREMIQRLVQIVSRCYAHHNSSYIIAFSSSLSAGNVTHGKISFVDLGDGSTRILNGTGQLIVVVRTTTINYDKEDLNRQRLKRRRSARLVANPIALVGSEMMNVRLKTAKVSLEKLPDSNLQSVQSSDTRRNIKRSCRSGPTANVELPKVLKVADDINQIKKSPEKKKPNTSTFLKTNTSRTKSKLPLEVPLHTCGKCGKEYNYLGLLQDHEILCLNPVNRNADIRDDPSEKDSFLQAMGLFNPSSNSSSTSAEQVQKILPKELEKNPPGRKLRKVASRCKIGTYIRTHPLPLTSLRGQQILEKFGERQKSENSSLAYEKYCSSRITRAPAYTPVISTLKKHLLKENKFVHKYSFNKKQRTRRNVELVVGLNVRSFRLLNKCKKVEISMERLSRSVVQECLQREERRKTINFQEILKKCNAHVVLEDFRSNPSSLPLWARSKILKSKLSKS